MVQAVWENDLDRVRIALISFAIYGALQLVAVARYSEVINWTSPQAWLFVLFPLGLLVSGGLVLALTKKPGDTLSESPKVLSWAPTGQAGRVA